VVSATGSVPLADVLVLPCTIRERVDCELWMIALDEERRFSPTGREIIDWRLPLQPP
jgi:hypothetical protein